jgi:hypothetical protein
MRVYARQQQQENNISDFKQLDNLKLIKLRELVLAGNPISAELDEATYRRCGSHRDNDL